uniref:1,4-beta-D-glucan-4-glucanohydrolase n=1 Tax=Orpinomyces sp. (strain PC-2) TaxID=50059 RepID=Q9HFE0_ORPSP|nr:1,4-beta-D-glucan-4-glucanohydrolase [Orpinomyces sp. PC-2]
MKFFKNTLALLTLVIAGSNAMRNIPSKDLVKELNIGWNLGNALDAHCLDKLDYNKDQLASETCWANPKATPGLFSALKNQGFNVFRIPTTWTGHFGNGPDYKISDVWMRRVHEVVDYALNTGSYVILNIHHENWNYAFSNNLQKAKPILAAIWKQIAAEFANYDEHLIFEGMNEPRKVDHPNEWNGGDQEGWDFVNEMNAVFLQTVRASGGNNAIRHLMIPTYAACVNDGALESYVRKFPTNDNKVIASVHSYVPYNFALNTGAGAEKTFGSTSDIEWAMNNIKRFLVDRNIPVIIGEFGAMNRDNESERARWAEYYIKSATAMGVPCVLWDNGYTQGTGELFGVIDRNSYRIIFQQFINGLMKGLGGKKTVAPAPTTTITTTTTVKVQPTNNNECFSTRLGYSCCNGCDVFYTDNDGKWGVENGNWCGIKSSCDNNQRYCWSERLGYPCCQYTTNVEYTDNDGRWGVENGNWCGIY